MKSMLYIFIITVICVTLTPVFSANSENTKSYFLQSSGEKVTIEALKKSAEIISARLKYYGLDQFDVTVLSREGQLRVRLADNVELSEVEGLLVSQGNLSFYETAGRDDFTDLLKNHESGGPLLDKSDVESISTSMDKASQAVITSIQFKPEAIRVWAEATRRNINKPIAIVVDDRIFFTPVVRDPIENGACEISGNMSRKEMAYFLALVNNEKLPLRFIVLK